MKLTNQISWDPDEPLQPPHPDKISIPDPEYDPPKMPDTDEPEEKKEKPDKARNSIN